MGQFRKMPDGRMWVPNKLPFPVAPEGYCQDENTPWIYHPVLVDCEYRFDKSETLSCGKIDRLIECHYYNKEVKVPDCQICKIPLSE
jgi:hypothetical protein